MRYEWNFGPAVTYDTETLTDVIKQINWYCNGIASDGSTYKDSGAVDLGPPDPSTFTPFSSMTKEQVQALIYTKVNKTAVEAKLADQHNKKQRSDVKNFTF